MRWLAVILALLVVSLCASPSSADPTSYEMYGFVIPGMITYETWYREPPRHFTTRALYQSEGVIEATAALKGYAADEHFVALLSPSTAGWRVFLRPPGHTEWTPARVVDVARREDMYFHAVMQHSAIELSWELAQLWDVPNMRNEHGDRFMWNLQVCVTDYDPESICASEPVDFEAWFEDIVEFVP